ncbi:MULTISPECIES: GspE/PulE family protein [Veillonella]|uniref:GspE/PulE family protein n=1 Tax=Veillonella TaxID=29465 RepID=UPI0003E2B672|nr:MULTISPECIES: GspE/PulE family protein [Veillonella]ETS93372.1 type II/IV secretion system protein [Veillonella sp. AS16]
MYVDVTLDDIILCALQHNVSDIHFDPMEEGVYVRFRQDGLLQTHMTLPDEEADLVLNRIKVCSALDISEKRLPQDGRWVWKHRNESVTMRVSTLPSLYGETVVCRLMGNEGSHKSLEALGMPQHIFEHIKKLLQRPYGLMLICGPTGSGKTATLYSMLRMLNLRETKLICLEDPVEAEIKGAIQIGINEKIGFTFAKGLRSVLRQDPDTIMIGEIRDRETAELAVKSALTGHRVLSTIHTNTAMGVVTRLMDMGVEPYLIRATLIGAVAQRLVRRFDGTVYHGRTALFEYLEIPLNEADWDNLASHLLLSLEDSANDAVQRHITSLEEVHRCGLLL